MPSYAEIAKKNLKEEGIVAAAGGRDDAVAGDGGVDQQHAVYGLDAFHDGIHKLIAAPRLTKKSEPSTIREHETIVTDLVRMCNENKYSSVAEQQNKWKMLLLALIHKRYHVLSPQAQEEAKGGDGADSKKAAVVAAGEGEREIFYQSVMVMFDLALKERTVPSPAAGADDNHHRCGQGGTAIGDALRVLLKAAQRAGGTRDVCTLVEYMVTRLLDDEELAETRRGMKALFGKESLSRLVGKGFLRIISSSTTAAHSALGYLLDLSASTLDRDITIVRRHAEGRGTEDEKVLPSTLHVYLPHRDRGAPSNNKKRKIARDNEGRRLVRGEENATIPDRQLANSVAEILIWSQTGAAAANKTFVHAKDAFLKAAEEGNSDGTKSNLHIMQTIIRNLRKELNSYGREQGFMLSDQFSIDPSVLSMKHVKRAKAGDISNLTRLATKEPRDARILKLINLRYASNPNKVAHFGSVQELIRSHAADPSSNQEDEYNADEEIEALERDIFLARLRATAKYLRVLALEDEKDCTKNGGVLVASLETSAPQNVGAILVAAALAEWNLDPNEESDGADAAACGPGNREEMVTDESSLEIATSARVYLAGEERDLSSWNSMVDLVDGAIAGMTKANVVDAPSFTEGGVATTKAVINLIDRHLRDKEFLVLITGSDLSLPESVMKGVTDRGCSVHCHDVDDVGERFKREGATRGDITISLAWDTFDDLDLHVIIPSGTEISYERKESEGCNLDVDMNAGGGDSNEPVENIFCGNLDKGEEAPKGEYVVFVQNFAYHTKPPHGEVPFRVVVERNGVKEKFSGSCKGCSKSSNVTVCKFNYGGRTVPFPKDEAVMTAFETSNLVNLTANTGQTLESLSQLVKAARHREHLERVRTLVNEEEEEEQETAEASRPRPTVADVGTVEVTSRDRIFILLSKLPAAFHGMVGERFGGPSLAEQCASEIAKRMVADGIRVEALRKSGYPDEIVDAVRAKMATAFC